MTVDDREINQSIVMDGWKFVGQVYKEASEEYGHVYLFAHEDDIRMKTKQ
jgi:hypothetical protein